MSRGASNTLGTSAHLTTSYAWMPLLALASTQLIESAERMALAQALEGIQSEFAVSDLWMGLLPFSMALVGALGSIPIGILSDRMRRTLLLAVAMLIWSLAMGLTALSNTIIMLFLMRMVLGAVEANAPAAVSLISDYYPVRERAKMLGLYQAGSLLGGVLGLVLGGIAVEYFGWRWAFGIWVPIGLAVAIWIWLTPEPTRGDRDRDFEREIAAQDLPPGPDPRAVRAVKRHRIELPEPHRVGKLNYNNLPLMDALRELIRIRSLWFACLGLGTAFMLMQAVSFWSVEYFRRVHDLGSATAGLLSAGLAVGAAVGMVSGGFISDRLFNRGVITARVWVTGLASIGTFATLALAFASSDLRITAPLMIIGGFLMTLPIAPSDAMLNDVVVSQLRGRALALRSVIRSIGMVGPVAVGAISNAVGLQTALVVFTPVYALGGCIVLLAVRHYPQELAFVVAESKRERLAAEAADGQAQPRAGGEHRPAES